MKKLRKFFVLVMLTFLFAGCGVGNVQNKTEFLINEEAEIDNYILIVRDYEELSTYNGQQSKNGVFVKVNYKITNKTGKSVSIESKNNFKLLNDAGTSYNSFNSNSIVIDNNASVDNYMVVFDTEISNSYNVLFYSNVATNNIAFKLEK